MSLIKAVLDAMGEDDEKQKLFVELLKECRGEVLWYYKYDKSVEGYLQSCEKLLEYNMNKADYKSYMESV